MEFLLEKVTQVILQLVWKPVTVLLYVTYLLSNNLQKKWDSNYVTWTVSGNHRNWQFGGL